MIVLGSDHAGYPLKLKVMGYLEERGLAYKDAGTLKDEQGDYPLFALKAANAVSSGEADKGILFCGTGIGISIAANKIKGIRCALCGDLFSARMSREHNDCNMLALGARVIDEYLALEIVDTWLRTEFAGGRHQKRVEQIKRIENGEDL
jgi:ribose 5-phosphate isomerase B